MLKFSQLTHKLILGPRKVKRKANVGESFETARRRGEVSPGLQQVHAYLMCVSV
jgi:hypothetical protein